MKCHFFMYMVRHKKAPLEKAGHIYTENIEF